VTQQHPIAPPPELVQKWQQESDSWHYSAKDIDQYIAACAAQWGADQELEACCSIALTDPVCGTKHQRSMLVRHMRERRRPKPPSLKEQALALLKVEHGLNVEDLDLLRRALEQLDD